MDDNEEPTLPLMPKLPAGVGTVNGRKRAFQLDTSYTEPVYSSDLGVFSSDDDPGLDNYAHGRHKRRYQGAWYDHIHASAPTADKNTDQVTPRKAICNDVFSTPNDHSSVPPSSCSTWTTWSHTSPPSSQKTTSLPAWAQMSPSSSQRAALPRPANISKQMARVQDVIQQIDDCIDHGKDTIDLTDQNLNDECIIPLTFEKLSKLRLVPHVDLDLDHPVLEKYLHRDSKIRLLLGNNELTCLPGTLFSIENLTTLSLRGNNLTELPPAVGHCRNLKELNIAYNKLTHLPFEVIEMIPSTTIYLYGNKLYEVERQSEEEWTERWHARFSGEEAAKPGPARVWYMGRGPVQFTDTAGRICSSYTLPAKGDGGNRIQTTSEQIQPTTNHHRSQHLQPTKLSPTFAIRVPSLAELCARSLVGAGQSEPYVDIPGRDAPDLVSRTCNAVAQTLYQGGQLCAICKTPFVTARAQWIEFYVRLDSYESSAGMVVPRPLSNGQTIGEFVIPSLRKGCSWKCVPYGREPEPWSLIPLRG